MSFKRRSSYKPSSFRECNKVRVTNKNDKTKIDSCVDFVLKMTVIMKNKLVIKT